jgi:hypothetical protein
MVDRFPGRQIVRQEAPGTATPQDIENGIEEVAHRLAPRPPSLFRGWQVRREMTPFSVRQVCWIRFLAHSPYSVGTAKAKDQFSDSLLEAV